MLSLWQEAKLIYVVDKFSPDHSFKHFDEVRGKGHRVIVLGNGSAPTLINRGDQYQEELRRNLSTIKGGAPKIVKGLAQLLLACLQKDCWDTIWARSRCGLQF